MKLGFLFLFFSLSALATPRPDKMIYVPLFPQEQEYTCGVASLRSVLHYYGQQQAEAELEKELKPTPEEGTALRTIEAFVKKHGYQIEMKAHMTIEAIKSHIDSGRPVIVMFQAWPEKKVTEWKDVWSEGHFAVASGYDQENLFFMDPSNPGKYAYIPVTEFITRWHDEDEGKRYEQLGLIITKPGAAPYLPFDKID